MPLPLALRIAAIALLVAPPLGAQDNPFTPADGPIRDATVVYALSVGGQSVVGRAELVHSGPRWALSIQIRDSLSGDTLKSWALLTADSIYRWQAFGDASTGSRTASFRPYLARAFGELTPAEKAAALKGIKAIPAGAAAALELLPNVIGVRSGTATVAGHKCIVWKIGRERFCALEEAPEIVLQWFGRADIVTLTATNVSFEPRVNGAFDPPEGAKFNPEPGLEGIEFFHSLYDEENERDSATVEPLALARWALRFIGSPKGIATVEKLGGEGED
jgi:hypothetical protein